MRKGEILARVDHVLAMGQATIDSVPPPAGGALARMQTTRVDPDHRWVAPDVAASFRSAGLSLLRTLFGPDSHYYKDFNRATDDQRILGAYRTAHGLLRAVREEVDRGWYMNTKALIAADIFSNILEMAEYLLAEHYKDAAAVLIGGSLEGHLRALAERHGIDTHRAERDETLRPRKAESLNQDLCKGNAYSLGDQKQITAWLDLRNEAGHGHYDKFTQDQVELMRRGVADFIARVPA